MWWVVDKVIHVDHNSNLVSFFLTPAHPTSSSHQTEPSRKHDRTGGSRSLLEVTRDFPSATDPARTRSSAQDLRRYSRSVFRSSSTVRVRRISTTSQLPLPRRLRGSRWDKRENMFLYYASVTWLNGGFLPQTYITLPELLLFGLSSWFMYSHSFDPSRS